LLPLCRESKSNCSQSVGAAMAGIAAATDRSEARNRVRVGNPPI
jgi:hypothetical protein